MLFWRMLSIDISYTFQLAGTMSRNVGFPWQCIWRLLNFWMWEGVVFFFPNLVVCNIFCSFLCSIAEVYLLKMEVAALSETSSHLQKVCKALYHRRLLFALRDRLCNIGLCQGCTNRAAINRLLWYLILVFLGPQYGICFMSFRGLKFWDFW